jgi:hypothetical protein
MVRSFEAAFRAVEANIVKFLVMPEPEVFHATSWAARLCTLGQCRIVDTDPP